MSAGASSLSNVLPGYFYEQEGSTFTPTKVCRGPWDKRWQSGVSLAGLVAHAAEQFPTPVPMFVARLSIDILRPTPMEPAEVVITPLREGKRLQLLEIELRHQDTVTVRASALRIREGESPPTVPARHALPPDNLPAMTRDALFNHICETRMESGGLHDLGDGVVWTRFFGEFVPGVPISPFVQLAMAADFGSGLSCHVDWREWSFANVDISLHLTRMPRGEWLRLAAHTDSAGNGTAVVDSCLSDADGDFGHAHQTLFLDRRSK